MAASNELAQAILAAAKRREQSFDHGAAARAEADGKSVSAKLFYKMTIREACEVDGVNPFISYPVYLLLSNSWDDAIEWAAVNV